MVDLNRRKLMATSAAAALGASVAGSGVAGASESEIDESDTPGAPSVKGNLKRFANTAFGAEVTGPYVFDDGSLLFSNQHPQENNIGEYSNPGVGYFVGFQFEFDGTNDDFNELGIPNTKAKQRRIRGSRGKYVYLGMGRDEINDGDELLGVTQTPDGTNVTLDTFEGTQYGAAATNPDCNQFVATNEEGTEGYLFTNWENSPGNVSRIPISRNGKGRWQSDLDNAVNLANTEAFRSLGGTRINCYGNKTPWNTMVTSEENYAHPRVSLTNTVGDIVDAESGEGLLGAAHFWNRPNSASIPGVIGDYADAGDIDSSWYPQGAFALAGVEFLAYYLGADQVDQGEGENTHEPISDVYPNPYRYGYHVEFRNGTADDPADIEPVKHYVLGRASWEAPDFENDHKTVYGCSDGDSKGIYKFVADEKMTDYDDPMEIAGTLYAPKITNDEANVEESGTRASPADINLEVDWIPLGQASNAEIEEWIADYDDVTQADYLEEHADTDWEDDLEAALKEADLEVIENGNQNYITDDEIVEWAEQYEQNGPDGVDEDLRKIPFLETRAAAKEIGASIEFNKAEGVDSASDAGPGDYVYFGISEFNDDLSDETGDIQMDRVDGGVVYRAELEADYNVSTLEPVIVGPDFTDGPEVANDALRNVDNVYVMDDGRVLCCEDGFDESRRSYPNDCLYVYEPNPMLGVEPVAVDVGESAESTITLSHLPDIVGELPNASGQVTVSVADPDVATITDAGYGDSLTVSGNAGPTITANGGAVTFPLGPIEEIDLDGAEAAIATITVTGNAEGETAMEVTTPLEQQIPEHLEFETKGGSVRVGGDGDEDGTVDDGNNGNNGNSGNNGNNGNSGN